MSRFVSATVITIMITSKITIGIQGTIITIGVIGIIMEMGSIAITEDITTTTRIKGTKERLITSTVAQNRAHSAFLAFGDVSTRSQANSFLGPFFTVVPKKQETPLCGSRGRSCGVG